MTPRRIYISNIAAGWPVDKQEKLLDAEVPGWRALPVSRDDDLSARTRQEHQTDMLTERVKALRRNTRATTVELIVAALPVLAWKEADFRGVLAIAAAHNIVLVALHGPFEVRPNASDAWRERIVEEFLTRRKRGSEEASRLKGAAVSAERRREAGKAGAEKIRDRWGLPSAQWPTAVLLAEAGITRNTANYHLGITRERAQMQHEAMLKRKDAAAKRKGKADG